jgi:hypothetical protein
MAQTAYSRHLTDWDQLAQTLREADRQAVAQTAQMETPEPEDDWDMLIDPCPSFVGLSADLGPLLAQGSAATETLAQIAATLPTLTHQFEAALEEIMGITRDVIREVYLTSFQANLPTILDNHLEAMVIALQKMTTDAVRIEVRMTTDDLPSLERRLSRHRTDKVSLTMIPSTAPGHCTANLTWADSTIAFDAGILARGVAEVFADPAILPAPPKAMRATSHWDAH